MPESLWICDGSYVLIYVCTNFVPVTRSSENTDIQKWCHSSFSVTAQSSGLISPDDRENAINFFRRPRESKIYQQTTARISTNDIAVFSTITLQNLYHSNINSLPFRQPNITSQPYIHSHSHCCYNAIPWFHTTIYLCAYFQLTRTEAFLCHLL